MISIQTKLSDPRCAPTRAHATDAGADLRSMIDVEIYPGEQVLVDTGVAVKILEHHVGLVFNRSSQGKVGIQIANAVGVIDSDYRGTIKVLLRNNGEEPYIIKAFDTRIAQLVIVPILLCDFVQVSTDRWNDTARGEGGFGSTGK